MSDQQNRGQQPSGYGDEIPRRGYTRRQTGQYPSAPSAPIDPEGQRTAPPPPPVNPPPVYNAANVPPPPQPAATQYAPRPGVPPPPVRGRRGERAPRDSGLYLPWWSLVILVMAVGGATLGILLLVMGMGSAGVSSQAPQFVIVTNPPSNGGASANAPQNAGVNAPPPNSVPSLAPSTTPNLPTLVPSRTPPPLAGGCQLNAEVIVVGTGPTGLSLRDNPRTSAERLWVAQEGDRLQIVDGPQFFDDYEWCKVNSLTRPGQSGWAVTEFMTAAGTGIE